MPINMDLKPMVSTKVPLSAGPGRKTEYHGKHDYNMDILGQYVSQVFKPQVKWQMNLPLSYF